MVRNSPSQRISDPRLRAAVESKAPAIRSELLKWFRSEARPFRWRTTKDPYVILIAELLLKKTTAPVVERFLPAFLQRYSDVRSLASARKPMLKALLKPLGLSEQRATQLAALSRTLRSECNCRVPNNLEQLLALPGVGEYTANSVLCVAFGKAKPVVDTNVARILIRIFGFQPSRFEARRSPEVWETAKTLVGSKGSVAKKVNWALLDLGAIACKARKPACEDCPLLFLCKYGQKRHRREGSQHRVG
jgi:A/G-specific adenine glycosylase